MDGGGEILPQELARRTAVAIVVDNERVEDARFCALLRPKLKKTDFLLPGLSSAASPAPLEPGKGLSPPGLGATLSMSDQACSSAAQACRAVVVRGDVEAQRVFNRTALTVLQLGRYSYSALEIW